jgi:hypothetical protein
VNGAYLCWAWLLSRPPRCNAIDATLVIIVRRWYARGDRWCGSESLSRLGGDGQGGGARARRPHDGPLRRRGLGASEDKLFALHLIDLSGDIRRYLGRERELSARERALDIHDRYILYPVPTEYRKPHWGAPLREREEKPTATG